MKELRHDDERLAALLEGRLEGPERDELLAYLATADEDLYVWAKTAAALREMEEVEAEQARQADEQATQAPDRETPPPSVRGGWRRWKASRVIVPPVLAGLAALMILVTRMGAGSAGLPVRLAESLDKPLPERWTEERPVAGSRGGALANDTSAAVQAGMWLVDLSLAIQAQDVGKTQLLAKSVKERFDPKAVASSPIVQIGRRAGDPPSELLPLVKEATERLPDRYERGYLELGAWGEAALLATHYQDAAFFRSKTTRTVLRRAERLTRDNSDARNALARIRSALNTDQPPQWSNLEVDLAGLINAMTN